MRYFRCCRQALPLLLCTAPRSRPCAYLSLVGWERIFTEAAGIVLHEDIEQSTVSNDIRNMRVEMSNPYSRNPYMDLDSLHRDILLQAAEDLGSVCVEDMKIVIFQLRPEMPLQIIARFLGGDDKMVEMALNRIQSMTPDFT